MARVIKRVASISRSFPLFLYRARYLSFGATAFRFDFSLTLYALTFYFYTVCVSAFSAKWSNEECGDLFANYSLTCTTTTACTL